MRFADERRVSRMAAKEELLSKLRSRGGGRRAAGGARDDGAKCESRGSDDGLEQLRTRAAMQDGLERMARAPR